MFIYFHGGSLNVSCSSLMLNIRMSCVYACQVLRPNEIVSWGLVPFAIRRSISMHMQSALNIANRLPYKMYSTAKSSVRTHAWKPSKRVRSSVYRWYVSFQSYWGYCWFCHNDLIKIFKTSDLIYNLFNSDSSKNKTSLTALNLIRFIIHCFQVTVFHIIWKEILTKKIKLLDGNEAHIFSVCQINIRNMKANPKDFINYFDVLHFNLQIIAVTENWLNDINVPFIVWKTMKY